MRRRIRRLTDLIDGGAAVLGLLAVALLVPMGMALWFVNDAATTQAEAARRSVHEAYRGQLRLVRSRVDAHWRAHAARLNSAGDPEQQFARLVLGGLADGLVILDAGGAVAYPDHGPRGSGAAADVERQLAAIERLGPAADPQPLERVASQLNDYTRSMPASERLALMRRVRAVAPNVMMPTQAALTLSLALVEGGRPAPEPAHFLPTAIANVWAFTSEDRRVVGLYWTGRLEALMHDALHQVAPAGIRFIAFPPDTEGDSEAIAAGPALPGWQLTFQPLDRTTFDDAARRQAVRYGSAAAGGLAIMAVLGVVAGRTFRRHLHIARLKTDLVAAVSHELRTPLASMRVLVDGLLADERIDPEKTRDYLRLLSVENARLSRLIENFLTFSRLERGRQQFVFSPVDPCSMVTTAADAIRDRLPAGSGLRVEIEPDLPPVVADADALVTALVNLLDNAVKYTPADDKQIRVHVRREREAVLFAVSDNGIGIPPRERRRIFRRFYRVDQRLARDTSGVGLGLSIVELIVRAHGGAVQVQSETGAGSTFTLRVPAVSQGVVA